MGATCLTPTVSACNGRAAKAATRRTVKFNAPAAGTYFIAIDFNAQSLLGQPAPSPTTVHYDFTTTGVPDSTSGLDLLEHVNNSKLHCGDGSVC